MQKVFDILHLLFLDEQDDPMLKRYLKQIFILCPVAVAGFTLIFSGADHFTHNFIPSLFVAVVVSNCCFAFTMTIRLFQKWLASRRGLPVPPRPGKGRLFVMSVAAMFPGCYIAFTIAHRLFPYFGPMKFTEYGPSILLASFLVAGVFLAEMLRDSQRAASKLEKDHMQAQISALTAQMNPHLLFNSLNTIASMIPGDPERAEEMTVKLSELYRGVLSASKQAKHSLARELEICRNYLSVEQARYGERLKVDFNVSPQIAVDKIEVPALSLQPLVENAVRHGIAPRSSGGKICLTVKDISGALELCVEDNGVGFGKSPSKGTGTGISNCRERLKLHYGDDAALSVVPLPGGGTSVRMEIPL